LLLFVHIPKTAGTTLHKILSHQYPADKTWIRHDSEGPWSAKDLERLREGSSSRPELIMGHLSTGLHLQVAGVRYLTCLREPVARLVSHYHHALHETDHYLHDAVIRRRLDLAGYVTSGLSGELSNGMTRMIAGIEDFDAAIPGPVDLERAKRLLETHFDGVLLSERFDEGLLLLAEKQGWSSPYYLRRKVGRYSARAARLDAATRRIIEDHNALDLELYQWARARFESCVAARPELSAKVWRFRQHNRHFGKVVFLAREFRRRFSSIPEC
jgi:hypothetical protein